MAKTTVFVPRINDSPRDFQTLFEIFEQVKRDYSDVYFDFKNCQFLRPNAIAFLGGLARWIQHNNGSFEFGWNTFTDSWVKTTVRQNGFANTFGDRIARWDGNSIPYREDIERDPNAIINYLEKYWLGKGWVHISSKLTDAIVGNAWEIYNNVFDHSDTRIGVFSCGQHFSYHNELTLAVIDFGVGIPAKVKNFLRQDKRAYQLPSSNCLQWAFQQGNTTKINEPGGLGLGLLKEFVHINQGKLEIYSNDGYAIIDKNGEKYNDISRSFEGTIVYITLRCDEKLYHFKDEKKTP